MSQTLVSLYVHIVFSTKNRANLIAPEFESDLYSYMGGILRNHGGSLLAANGTANHSHLLVSLSKNHSLAETVGDLKRDSSKWVKNEGDGPKNFKWQDGYGAFSVGQTQIAEVKKYIARQKEKHAKHTFENEMRGFFKKYEIEYDEKYVWD